MERAVLTLALAAALWAAVAAAPARATQDGWPALFDVHRVAADDVLNIRAEPSAGAAIVGTLAPDAEAVEVIRPNGRETWGLVNTGEGTGWVSLAFLKRRPGQWYGAPPEPARCLGTEPFWGLSFTPWGGAVWERAGEPAVEGDILETLASINRRDAHGFSLRFPSSAAGDVSDGVGILTLAQCTDGMSSREYGLRLELILGTTSGGEMFSGCCTLAP